MNTARPAIALHAAVSIGLLLLATFVPIQSVSAQSFYPCKDASGRTWVQNQRCPTPTDETAALHKCVTPRGAVSIQNAPCPTKSKTIWKRATAPEIENASTRQRQADTLTRQSADARALSRLAGTDRTTDPRVAFQGPSERDQRLADCAAAKRNRESVLAQVGLRRTYSLLQDLDASVYRACKGL